ncbi:integrase catalytic domain-containing protein [Trichonephila clavipes]|nr:integrase catalytic domain-containing protein [Trichonephila clavipes]
MIEELHRPLKSAIKCHATERWTEVLPIILLGLRASLKEDILCTPAELVFGTTIRLPGEMFDSSKPDDDVVNFVSKLKSHMQSLHPKPPKHHGKRPVFIHPGLLEATHVFLRRDICKPAFFFNTEDLQLPQTKNETPATVEPNATASTPATVESDPTASTPTQPSTRSGRKVHLPTSFLLRSYACKATPDSSVATGNENPDAGLERKAILPHFGNIQHSNDSFRNPNPDSRSPPRDAPNALFGIPSSANSIPEREGGNMVVPHYPPKLREFLN